MPSTPEYADEILDETSRIRQRPRWTFPRRWLPIPEVPWSAAAGRRVALASALLVVLGLLLAAVAAFVGGPRALPPPFGLAGNGLLASAVDGDIVVINPRTMTKRTIVGQSAIDRDAHWSLDGTRLAFIREDKGRLSLGIAAADGHVLAVSESFEYLDSDSVAWSPDGRQVAISANRGERQAIFLIDAATGAARQLGVPHDGFEVYWRPPDGRQLLFRVGNGQGGLGIVSLDDDETFVRVPMGNENPYSLRPLGWTRDGRGVLFQDDSVEPTQTVVVDIETGTETRLGVGFGHLSNDGLRVAGIDPGGRLCVVSISGGPCVVVDGAVPVDGSHGAGVRWSPDDRWLAISVDPVWLVDPTNVVPPREIVDGGPGSWQRTLP